MERFLVDLDPGDLRRLAARSADLRASFLAADLPPDLAQEIHSAYRTLHDMTGAPEPRVAVRSSATAEDLPEASFAGQHDFYLGVLGQTALAESIKCCWVSLWNAQAVSYRQTNGIDHAEVLMSVVVQHMAPSVSAGVLFTANPVSGDTSEMVINASWGLGESVVAGSVEPDTFFVDKGSDSIKARSIGAKESMVELDESSGTIEVAVPPALRQRPSLTDDQVLELGTLAMSIDQNYGSPQDIEWAHDGTRFHILQARPITSLGPPRSADASL